MLILKHLYQVLMAIPVFIMYSIGTVLYNVVFFIFKGDIHNAPHITWVDKCVTKLMLLKD
jgi:hypothetical protein